MNLYSFKEVKGVKEVKSIKRVELRRVKLLGAGVIVLAAIAAMPMATSVSAQIPVGTRVGGPPPSPGSYESLGRRDPFVTLIAPRRAATPGLPRTGIGLGSFQVNDVVVTGITKAGPDKWIAILQSVDKQSYVAKVKDRLSDAVVKSIDAASVVFLEIPEPGSYTRPREIRKLLHSVDEVNR